MMMVVGVLAAAFFYYSVRSARQTQPANVTLIPHLHTQFQNSFPRLFTTEVRAILRTDLVRLPDVQHLLWENLLFVESLKLVSLEKGYQCDHTKLVLQNLCSV